MLRLCATLLAAFFAASAAADGGPVVVRQLYSGSTTAAGQPIALPQKDVRVSVSTYDIAPGARLPVHKHPFPRYAYVLSGTLAVTDATTGEAKTYREGDFIVEMLDRWHFGTNVGPEPVRLLVIDQTGGETSNTILKD